MPILRTMPQPTSATLMPMEAKNPTLQEILVALSFALDLTEGAVPGHAIRSCLLALRIAGHIGLPAASIADLYFASLLKDVGCSSNSARMCHIVGGDDRLVKAGAKLADWTRPLRPDWPTLKLLWQEVLPGAAPWSKTARIARLALTQHANNQQLIDMRCDRGATIVRRLGLPTEVAVAVRHLDEHWDGGGYPQGLRGNSIPMLARLMAVAQHLDAFCMERGPGAALKTLTERSGRWFDPQLVRAARSLERSGNLFRHCLPTDPPEAARASLLRLSPAGQTQLSALDIDSICETFAYVVDAKSPFTFRHSLGVMHAAVAIGGALHLHPERMQLLRRAALLHDIGKLGISNTILDKPTRLTEEEMTAVQRHPAMSANILGHISSFREVAVLAREHHEKLDGSGYPAGLRADDLSLESRLLAVADIYGALSEDRPYRAGLDPAQIRGIMDRDVPARLDPTVYAALRSQMDDLGSLAHDASRKASAGWSADSCDLLEAYI